MHVHIYLPGTLGILTLVGVAHSSYTVCWIGKDGGGHDSDHDFDVDDNDEPHRNIKEKSFLMTVASVKIW